MAYDPFQHFEPKASGTYDSDYGYRAFVSYSMDMDDGRVVNVCSTFPPVQLTTLENKYDFQRHLNLYLDSLRVNSKVTRVEVTQGGLDRYVIEY